MVMSSAHCWIVLGIEPTEDKTLIKKAYASQLKKYNPEDFPEKFIEIREAYTDALSGYYQYDEPLETDTAADCGDQLDEGSREDAEQDTYLDITSFEICINELIEDPERKNDTAEWQIILNDDRLWSIEFKTQVGHSLFQHLAEKVHENSSFKYAFNKTIWAMLDEAFDWKSFELIPYYTIECYEPIFNRLSVARGEEESLESLIDKAELDSQKKSGFSLSYLPIGFLIFFFFSMLSRCDRGPKVDNAFPYSYIREKSKEHEKNKLEDKYTDEFIKF